MAVDTPTPRQAERVAPELAVAKLDLRDIALLAAIPALLAAWAIERNPDRLRDLSRNDVKDKHGLFEQRHMAPFLGMTPNTLAQSLKRLRLRIGEETRLLWQIETTDDYDGEQER